MSHFLRADLKNYTPYDANVPSHTIKLDANESPYKLPEEVKKQLLCWLENEEELNRYPDSGSGELRSALAEFWGLLPENFVCGVGSDQIIDYIVKAFLLPNDAAVVEKPSFSMYAHSVRLNHGKVISFTLNDRFLLNTCDIIKTAKENNAKIIFLCSPNNPTGNSLLQKDILEIVSSFRGVVVVDEAYAEFSGESVVPFIEKYDNLIVIRTFSKAYGLAGARVGYAVCNKSLAMALNIVKAPYNLNVLSQKLAFFALTQSNEYKKRIKEINNNRDDFYTQLCTFSRENLLIASTDANFFYIKAKKGVFEYLLENGVLVRIFEKDESETIRLSVGTKEQNERVIELLKQLF